MGSLEVFICDLTHTGSRIANEGMPLGAGFIACHTERQFGQAVSVRLIKYPEDLLAQLANVRPDVVAFANYVWNNDLNEWFCARIKKAHPHCVTVKGGPNFPTKLKDQYAYLQRHRFTDVYVPYEGEIAFEHLVRAILEKGPAWREASLPGSVFLAQPGAQSLKAGGMLATTDTPPGLIVGAPVPRIRDLEAIVPSPYLEGRLDPFFDGKLTPVIQRTRGCPFTCNYCNEGDAYYNKVNKFPVERTIAELHYIGERISKQGGRSLIITDMNFGMFPEDLVIAQEIRKCQEKYGWPLNVLATTGKNRIDRIAEVFKSLEDTVVISMSMQSMSETVLETIRRQNIKPDMYLQLTSQMTNQPKLAELILPLPNETFESYLASNRFLINSGVDKVVNYTLQINMGTDYDDADYLRQYGYKTYFRPYANCFGIYEGEVVMEAEEVGVATSTISEDDYLQIRKFAFMVELIYNNSIFAEYFKLLRNYDIEPYSFVLHCFNHTEGVEPGIEKAVADFLAETRNELFASQDELKAFFRQPENYARLAAGELGRNVIFSNKALVLATMLEGLIGFVARNFETFVADNRLDISPEEIADITAFAHAKLSGILSSQAPAEERGLFSYDVLRWLAAEGGRLKDFRGPRPTECVFYFDDKQRDERLDIFSRYGDDVLGCMKILARVPNHQKLIRRVRYGRRDAESRAA